MIAVPRTRNAIALIVAVAAAGLLIAFQGWRSRGPDFDVTPAMARAVAFVERGVVPPRGTLTDLGSYFPAGTSWLLVPGVVLLHDPRLVELFTTGALYLLTLVGIFLLARRLFDVRVAVAAVVIYALSQQALNLASWLWPRGHPVFYIWIAYCCERWIAGRSGVFAAYALALWSVGMYVHFELAPAILMPAAVWIAFRPPVEWRALAIAGAALTWLWMPYLRLEATRGFIDVQSQLLLRSIDARGVERVPMCGEEPTTSPVLLPYVPETTSPAVRVATMLDLVPANLNTRVVGGEFLLLALMSLGLLLLACAALGFDPQPRGAPRVLAAGVALLCVEILAVEATLRWGLDPAHPMTRPLLALRRLNVVLVCVLPVAGVWRAAWDHLSSRFLLLAVSVPWAVLLLLTEEGGDRRFIGLWPLQSIVLGVAVIAVAERMPQRRWVRSIGIAVVVAIVAANLLTVKRLRDWRLHGWSGQDAPRLLARDYRVMVCD